MKEREIVKAMGQMIAETKDYLKVSVTELQIVEEIVETKGLMIDVTRD